MTEYVVNPHGVNAGTPSSFNAGKYVNVAAAAISVALIAGVGVWGYKLLVRDVTGVPVVRALEGEMRIAPENPGGEIARHTGLSVNSVPADGGAAEPEDRLILAPSVNNLQAEDLEVEIVGNSAEAGEVAPEDHDAITGALAATLESGEDTPAAREVDPALPLSEQDVLALADQIAAGVTPMGELEAGETPPPAVSLNASGVVPNVIPDAVPGVRQSLRPSVRPASFVQRVSAPAPVSAPEATSAAATEAVVTGVVTTTPFPAGTNLVQLGAFDSADIAAAEWQRFTTRFPDFFEGKDQVIQQATSGGRTFYRLRAVGFDDLNDARRFCSAMSAQGPDCIPVVVR